MPMIWEGKKGAPSRPVMPLDLKVRAIVDEQYIIPKTVEYIPEDSRVHQAQRGGEETLLCINERAKAANDDPRFSVRIRDGLPRMSLDGRSVGVMP